MPFWGLGCCGIMSCTNCLATCEDDARHCLRSRCLIFEEAWATGTFPPGHRALQGASTCATYLVEKLPHVPERPPADGSGAARAKLVAKLEKLDVRQQGLAEAAARGVAFHHAGACSMSTRVRTCSRVGGRVRGKG